VENGEINLFWHYKWANQVLAVEAPAQFSFAKNKMISVQKAFSHGDFTDLFQLPLSQVAFQQLQHIQQLIGDRPLSDNGDIRSYMLGVPIFTLQPKFINCCLDIKMFILFLNGFVRATANQNTKCFSGF
jgi:hypothetical protein